MEWPAEIQIRVLNFDAASFLPDAAKWIEMDVLILEFVLAHDSSPKGTSTYLMFEIKINQVGKGSWTK